MIHMIFAVLRSLDDPHDLHDPQVMTKALLMEREAFIELLILNGFSMHKFLSVKVTWETWDHMRVYLNLRN